MSNFHNLKSINIFDSLRKMFYYLEDNNINDDRVLNMNYCGYIVKLDFFNEL